MSAVLKKKTKKERGDAVADHSSSEEDDASTKLILGETKEKSGDEAGVSKQSGDSKVAKSKETLVGNKTTTDALLIESAANKMVAKVTGMANWANASMLSIAVGATIEYSSKQKADSTLWSWVYFAVVFALAYALTIVEHVFDEPRELAEELKVTVPPRSAAKGDRQALAEVRQLRKRGERLPQAQSALAAAWKVANFVELETSAFAEAFAELCVSTLANVAAMAFNAAMMASFGHLRGDGAQTASAFVFALIVSVLAIFVTLHASRALETFEDEVYNELKQSHEDESRMKATLLKYASKRRSLVLLCAALSFSIGLAWRSVAKCALSALIQNEATTVASVWTHAFSVALIVASANTVSLRYDMFLPKNKAFAFQMQSKEREMLFKAWHNAIQTVAGLAWFDAVQMTIAEWTGKEATVAALWVAAFLLIVLSLAATQLWERMSFEVNASVHGAVHAIYELFPAMHDPCGIRHSEKGQTAEDEFGELLEEYLEHSFIRDYMHTFVTLSLASFAVAAGKSVAIATSETLKLIYKGYYDADEVNGDDVNGKFLTSIWTALFISFTVWTLILMYLVRLLTAARAARRQAFDVIKDQMDDIGLQLFADDEDDDHCDAKEPMPFDG